MKFSPLGRFDHIGCALNRGNNTVDPALVIINDGNTVAWYDYLLGITKSGGDLVSVWADQSGTGHNLLHSVGYTDPLWHSTNGILFVTDALQTAPFALIMPEFIYMVVNPVTWGLNGVICDGNAANSGAIKQRSTTPKIAPYNGGSAPETNMTLGSWHIIRCLFNNPNSKLIVDADTPVSFTGANEMGGFGLGVANGGAVYANFYIKEAIIRKSADSAEDEAAIYAYLKNKYTL